MPTDTEINDKIDQLCQSADLIRFYVRTFRYEEAKSELERLDLGEVLSSLVNLIGDKQLYDAIEFSKKAVNKL